MNEPVPMTIGQDARVHEGWFRRVPGRDESKLWRSATTRCGLGGLVGGQAKVSQRPVDCPECLRLRGRKGDRAA